jgi:tetratricopeptide (TPR) repeat protein
MQGGGYREAVDKLNALKESVSANDYESAVVDQALGYAYLGLDQADKAITAFARALERNALPPEVAHGLDYTLAQLLARQSRHQEAARHLARWFETGPDPAPEAHLLAASVYYELKQYRRTITHAQAAIRTSNKPQESWYQLLLAAHIETGELRPAAELLEQMLERFPDNKSYWSQLVGIYQRLKQDERALAVTELAYRSGLLDDREKLQLARMYLYLQAPYRAAQLLESELERGGISASPDSLALLADAWLLAQEHGRAAETLKQAVEESGDPEWYFRLGQILAGLERWQEAAAALERAVAAGKLKNIAEAYLLLGIAAYETRSDARSLNALNKALEYEHTRAQAEYWIEALNRGRSAGG